MGPRESLNAYLSEIRHRPFEWGKHDCLTFTNEAWNRMYGHGWADEWIGQYMKGDKLIGRRELTSELNRLYGSFTLEGAIDTRWRRVEGIPPLGALVTTAKYRRWHTGVAMGISTGRRGVFLSDEGVLYMPLTDIKDAWLP
jgi:hypothetical protein